MPLEVSKSEECLVALTSKSPIDSGSIPVDFKSFFQDRLALANPLDLRRIPYVSLDPDQRFQETFKPQSLRVDLEVSKDHRHRVVDQDNGKCWDEILTYRHLKRLTSVDPQEIQDQQRAKRFLLMEGPKLDVQVEKAETARRTWSPAMAKGDETLTNRAGPKPSKPKVGVVVIAGCEAEEPEATGPTPDMEAKIECPVKYDPKAGECKTVDGSEDLESICEPSEVAQPDEPLMEMEMQKVEITTNTHRCDEQAKEDNSLDSLMSPNSSSLPQECGTLCEPSSSPIPERNPLFIVVNLKSLGGGSGVNRWPIGPLVTGAVGLSSLSARWSA